MDLKKLPIDLDFMELGELIVAEWPDEWDAKTDDEKILVMKEISNSETDVNKVLIHDGKKIGWYRYSRWPRESGNHTHAHTLDIVILPDFRKQGLGTVLMNDLIKDCRSHGYKNLKSRTLLENRASEKLHLATGFREAFRTGDSIIWEIDL
jgi:L-amino acid N-acyltransferase YncA